MNNTKESVILAGDFNAPHNQWGYKKTLRKGRLIASLCKKHNLKLLNDANTPTRFGASAQQDDTSPDLTWASRASEPAKRYTLELDRSTWQIHCMGMAGKTKNKNTGSNLALHLHISEDELATLAAETFFPQPSTPSPSDCYQIQTENAHLPEDSLFTMGELVFALNTAKSVHLKLNHAAMRVITGLPKITPVAQLHSAAQLNCIREIAAEILISQKLRLQGTQAGRLILSHLGDPVFQVPSNAPPNPLVYTPLNPCYVKAPHYQYPRSPWYLRALVLRLISCHLTARRLLLEGAIELRVTQLSSVIEPVSQQAGL
ncbi:hypothetical protein HPB47_015584 [Ixodes persulcatus]|uniref:Uncharacterized protein n=1 Tax=Ixodes persulcatus TaxID=34615 RepID=A0AC60QT37_IXOPE|nr:hypothetical protein HPB47_015584 [Ixodes persulcatus]